MVGLHILDLLDHDGALDTGVVGDLAERFLNGAPDDIDADLHVAFDFELVQGGLGPEQGDAAAGHDALFNGRLGGVHGILDPGLLFLELGLGGRSDLDQGDAADHLGQALLELFAVVVGRRIFDLGADLFDPGLNVLGLALALDDGRVVLVDDGLLGLAQPVGADVFELDADVLGDDLPAGQDGDVLEHGLAPVAEARGLDGAALEGALELVDDQGGQRLALDLFGDDEKRTAHLGHVLEQGQEFSQVGDLLLMEKNQRIVEDAFHAVGIGDEIRGQVAAVELHALDDVHGRFEPLGFLDRDDAVLAHLVHGIGDDLADVGIVVGRDGADLGDHFAGHFAALLLEVFDDDRGGFLNPLLDHVGIGAGRDVFQSFGIDGLGQDRSRRGAVAGHVRGLGRDFLDELGAHVFPRVLELDFLGHGDAVLGARGRAEFLVQDDVLAAGAERFLDEVAENIDALEQALPGVVAEYDLFCHVCFSYFVITARISSSRTMTSSTSSTVTSVPLYLPIRTVSPFLTWRATVLPSSVTRPLPASMTSAS